MAAARDTRVEVELDRHDDCAHKPDKIFHESHGQQLGKGTFGIVQKFQAAIPDTDGVERKVIVARKNVDRISAVTRVGEPNYVKMIENETRAVKLTQHQNIATVFGTKTTADGFQIYMEFLPMDLHRYCSSLQKANLRIGDDHVLWLAQDLVNAMAFLHSQRPPLYHRDLKDENVLMVQKGGPGVGRWRHKLCDNSFLGTVPEKEDTSFQTEVGSRWHQAPEVTNRKYDHRVDIYSAGVTLFRALVFPLEANWPKDTEFLTRIFDERAMLSDELRPHIRDICLRMMADNPDERPPLENVNSHAVGFLDLMQRIFVSPFVGFTKVTFFYLSPDQQTDDLADDLAVMAMQKSFGPDMTHEDSVVKIFRDSPPETECGHKDMFVICHHQDQMQAHTNEEVNTYMHAFASPLRSSALDSFAAWRRLFFDTKVVPENEVCKQNALEAISKWRTLMSDCETAIEPCDWIDVMHSTEANTARQRCIEFAMEVKKSCCFSEEDFTSWTGDSDIIKSIQSLLTEVEHSEHLRTISMSSEDCYQAIKHPEEARLRLDRALGNFKAVNIIHDELVGKLVKTFPIADEALAQLTEKAGYFEGLNQKFEEKRQELKRLTGLFQMALAQSPPTSFWLDPPSTTAGNTPPPPQEDEMATVPSKQAQPSVESGGMDPSEQDQPPVESGGTAKSEEAQPPVESGGTAKSEQAQPPVESGGMDQSEQAQPLVESGATVQSEQAQPGVQSGGPQLHSAKPEFELEKQLLEKEIQELKKVTTDLQTRNAELEEQVKEFSGKQVQLEEAVKEAEQTVFLVKEEEKTYKTEISRLREQLHRVSQLEAEIILKDASHKAEIDSLSKLRKEADDKIAVLEQQLQISEQQLQTTTASIPGGHGQGMNATHVRLLTQLCEEQKALAAQVESVKEAILNATIPGRIDEVFATPAGSEGRFARCFLVRNCTDTDRRDIYTLLGDPDRYLHDDCVGFIQEELEQNHEFGLLACLGEVFLKEGNRFYAKPCEGPNSIWVKEFEAKFLVKVLPMAIEEARDALQDSTVEDVLAQRL